VFLVGLGALIEMVYHVKLDLGTGPEMKFMGHVLNVDHTSTWLGALAIAAVGAGILWGFGRVFATRWGQIQEQIEAELARRAGL
jgi:branched-chain amino acid transport system permease protein